MSNLTMGASASAKTTQVRILERLNNNVIQLQTRMDEILDRLTYVASDRLTLTTDNVGSTREKLASRPVASDANLEDLTESLATLSAQVSKADHLADMIASQI